MNVPDTLEVPGAVLEDAVPLLIGITSTLTLVSALLLGMRIYVRITRRTFGVDDSFMVAGWVFYFALVVISIGAAVRGLGLKEDHFSSLAHLLLAAKWLFYTQVFYMISILFVKCSICMTLLRFTTWKVSEYVIYGVMGLMAVQSIITLVLIFISCKPIAFHWDQSIEGGSCDYIDQHQDAILAYSIISVLTDVFCALFPIALLYKVQMNFKTKGVVVILLGMGVFASICTMLRLHRLVSLAAPDYLYKSTYILIWSIVETGFGIIASSGAASRPLFRRFAKGTPVKDCHVKSTFGSQSQKNYSLSAAKLPSERRQGSLHDDEIFMLETERDHVEPKIDMAATEMEVFHGRSAGKSRFSR